MTIYAIRVINANGTEDMEFLDKAPADSLIDGLFEGIRGGEIQFFSIREGNVNGGDSVVIHQSHG